MLKQQKKKQNSQNVIDIVKPYEYKLVNFLYAFHKMGFEFLENEPELLVEKVLSVDPNWIGHASFEAYGDNHDKSSTHYTQSTATKVPCLEGEWVVVCYSKSTKRIDERGAWYGSEWHKYYLCKIDFSQEYLFTIVKDFEHIYDAFKYLYENKLVTTTETDRKFEKQVTFGQANIALSVLSDFEELDEEFAFEEMVEFFAKHSRKSKEINDFLDSSCPEMKEKQGLAIESIRVRRFLAREPYNYVGFDKNLTIKQYLDLIREFKKNYMWNI